MPWHCWARTRPADHQTLAQRGIVGGATAIDALFSQNALDLGVALHEQPGLAR
jgi:hypothetical protein